MKFCKHQTSSKNNLAVTNMRKKPLRLLAVLLAFILTITLCPTEALKVQAEDNTNANNNITTDGGAVTWDFTDENAAIYQELQDGSLSVSGTFRLHTDPTHGAVIGNDTVFTIQVPAGQTTLDFSVCRYSHSIARISVGDEVLEHEFMLQTDEASDVASSSIQYTSESSATITIAVTGNGYLHSITAKTITPPQVATVSGTVTIATGAADSAVGETLIFTDEEEKTVETEITEERGYSVALPVGHTYTVSFKNSDIYEITGGGTIDLTGAENGSTETNNISYKVIWDTSKKFNFTIGDTTYTVTPGESSSKDFSVEASDEKGSVELATTDTAIIWADLEGAGSGNLRSDSITNVSDNVTYKISGNTITFTYTDTNTSPGKYTVQVKDNSASGKPHADGQKKTYDFGDGSVVSNLYTGSYSIKGGASVNSTDGLVTVTGNKGISYNGSHGIMIGDGDRISVKVAGNAEIQLKLCSYTAPGSTFNATVTEGSGTVNPTSTDAKVSADGDTASFQYTGEATTLTFTYNGSGSGYLHSMSVTNESQETITHPQKTMPSIPDGYGDTDGMKVNAQGQRLTLSQEGGSLATGAALTDNVGYYGFDATTACNRLEADVIVNSCGNSSANGVFFGAFNGEAIETIGIRNSTNLRGIYSNASSQISARGEQNVTITSGQKVHFTAEKTADGFVITATPEGGETYTVNSSDSDALFSGGVKNAEISFGFILANASVTVTNMKYYHANGAVLYDQNDCYKPIGEVPVVTSVQANIADTRDAINVTWGSKEEAYGDGRYVIQVKKNDGEWTTVAETTESTYTYSTTEAGTYEFRVGGKLGSNDTVDDDEWVATNEALDFLPALPTPVVTLTAHENSIDVSWTTFQGATQYEIYRYSSDEGAENAKVVYTADSTDATLSWTDTDVEKEVPYYYYVISYQEEPSNSSNPSEAVWAMASAGHTGDYVYEDEAAKITLTKCPDATVFQSNISIGGTVDRAGQLKANVNGKQVSDERVTANGTFNIRLSLDEGRNTVELLFTDSAGKVTRQTRNFVYLTNYDKIVDASYTGEDGTEVDGVPTYSTVQAAVNAVPADNKERQIIYIKAGDYEERLVVENPYISLLGEDPDRVRIHCYPANLYENKPDKSDYEAGGDMSKRCATYVTDEAAGFSAENITFANDYVYATPDGKSNKSADALRCDAEGATFVNVTISGVQDTLYMNAGHQYFYQCRIEGLIDFIYSGDNARALFEDCDIVFVYEASRRDRGGYVCAPRTAENATYGLIFNNCSITAEEGCVAGIHYLARPWGPNAFIYWINCYMGSAINKDVPYDDMSGNLFTAARFFECGSYGPGYAVNADRRQISPEAAKTLLSDASLGWEPDSKVKNVSDAYVGDMPALEEPIPDEPATEEPTTEEPTTEAPEEETPTMEDSSATSQTSSVKLTAGMLVADKNNEAVYKVTGSASSGYTLTCVRASSKHDVVVKIPSKVTVNGVSYPVTSIAANAFKGQKTIRKVVIGANVTSIGKKAFKGCSNLKKVVVKSKKLQTVGAKAFAKINKKAVIKVPKGKMKAYKKIFKKKTGVKKSMLKK